MGARSVSSEEKLDWLYASLRVRRARDVAGARVLRTAAHALGVAGHVSPCKTISVRIIKRAQCVRERKVCDAPSINADGKCNARALNPAFGLQMGRRANAGVGAQRNDEPRGGRGNRQPTGLGVRLAWL